MLHVAQASVEIDKVLLHLVHALGEVGGENLESYFQLYWHVVVTHGVVVADTRCVGPWLGMVVIEEEGGTGRRQERAEECSIFLLVLKIQMST
jgi:hypothetical protein